MSPRQLLRKPTLSIQNLLFSRSIRPLRRFQSTNPAPQNSNAVRTQARADKVLNRVPRFLRRYTDGLRNAPVTHVVAFLVLHEITAVVPLIGLASFFHYTNWLPVFFSEGAWVSSGVEKFGKYFRRKEWFGLSNDESVPPSKRTTAWSMSEKGTRIVVEVATAYAVAKALLPVRLMVSVWATPWFARVAIGKAGSRIAGLWGRVLGHRRGGGKIPAAGTGSKGLKSGAVKKEVGKT